MIYQEIMPFGKHKGKTLKEVIYDYKYCQWLIPKMYPSELRNRLLALAVCIHCKQMNGYTMLTTKDYEDADDYYDKYYKGLGEIHFINWNGGGGTYLMFKEDKDRPYWD